MSKSVYTILSAVTSTGAGSPIQLPSSIGGVPTSRLSFQAYGTTSSGSGTAVISVQVSNDGSNWLSLGTISLTLGTSSTSDGFVDDAPWAFVRGNITTLTGTTATVSLVMGV